MSEGPPACGPAAPALAGWEIRAPQSPIIRAGRKKALPLRPIPHSGIGRPRRGRRQVFLLRNAATSRLQRLLDHWTGAEAEAPRQDVAERLGQWLGMHDALRLQAAQQLVVSGEHAPAGVERSVADADALGLECRRLRAALQAAIAAEQADPALGPEAGFPAYHRRYLGHQRRLQASIDSLRGRARQALAEASPELARLALLDGSVQQLFGAREQKLLAQVPLFLKERFERLHRQEPDETGAVPLPLAWFDTFRRDVQEALLAELETRLQPVLGMIDALHQDTKLSS